MTGSTRYLLQHRLFLSFWILSICIYLVNSQATPTQGAPPNLMELSNMVQTMRMQFEGFKSYVETELAKLSGSVTACCAGGGGGGPMYRPIDLQISKTKVDISAASKDAVYSLEYKAIKKPMIVWRVNSEPAMLTGEGYVTGTFNNGKGLTELRVDPTKKVEVSLIVDQVTNVVTFRENPNKTASMTLRPTNFYVDSGAHGSFSYVQNKPMNILVSSPKYYPGFSTHASDHDWTFWMANNTAQPPVMEEYPQVREMNGITVTVGPIRILKKIQHPTDLKVVYELMTDKGDYDGILIFSKHYKATDNSSVISDFTEMRYVFVSRQDRYDPFPTGFISFVRRDPPVKPCKLNQTCSIACHAVGVVPEGMQLFKIAQDNTLMELNLPKLEVREPYMLYSHFAIKRMGEKDEGDYICSTYTRTSRTDIRTSLRLSEPVEFVNASSGITWAGGSVTVSCAAKGRPLPQIRLFENYVTAVEMVSTPNVFIDRGVERLPGGEYVATVKATIQLAAMGHLWRVICIAKNQFETKGTHYQIKNEPRQFPWGGPFGQPFGQPQSPAYSQGPPPPPGPPGPGPQYPGPPNPAYPGPQNPPYPGPPNAQYPGPPNPQYPGPPNPQYPGPPTAQYNQGPPSPQYMGGPPNPQYNQAAANSPFSPAAANPYSQSPANPDPSPSPAA